MPCIPISFAATVKLRSVYWKEIPVKNWQNTFRDFEMDLVVVGLSRFNLIERIISSISISRLARKTNVPVLAVGSSGLICHFKKIILPLHDDVSVQRIKMATMLPVLLDQQSI